MAASSDLVGHQAWLQVATSFAIAACRGTPDGDRGWLQSSVLLRGRGQYNEWLGDEIEYTEAATYNYDGVGGDLNMGDEMFNAGGRSWEAGDAP